MEYWMIIPLILFALSLVGTNVELYRLKKEVEKLQQRKKKKK